MSVPNKEFLFYTESSLEYPLDESIDVIDNLIKINKHYLVSNIQTQYSESYAPEINFYVNNTKDNIGDKINNIKKLYNIRLMQYDNALDIDFNQEVGKKLFIISCDDLLIEELNQKLSKLNLEVTIFKPTDIIDINGHIGKLKVYVKKADKEIILKTDQIIWPDAPYFAKKRSGIYDPNKLELDIIIDMIEANIPIFKYKNYIKYDSNICQYHERQIEVCGKCEEICPTVAIIKIDKDKHLEFSNIDCQGCGGCVSVCPSGALDFTQMTRDSFSEIASCYEDKVALLLPTQMIQDNLTISLKENILPLAIEGRKFLDEVHFLTLLQASGNPVIFYTDFISKGSGDAIKLINEIFDRKYNKKAIYICKNKDELLQAQKDIENIRECKIKLNTENLLKREIFTYRLSFLVGDDDLGIINTNEHIHYGNIKINETNCTLCLACVGACNVKALTAHPEDNSLRFNPSMCTNCGYCEFICPEKDCLEVVYDEMELNKKYFKKNIMAKDKLFKCIECGVEFATVKSIERIANIMKPRFGNDEAKIKALYCCADCKPKVTLQAHLEQQYNKKDI
jgi:ferredoxin